MKPWTNPEIRQMQRAIAAFYLENKPTPGPVMGADDRTFVESFRAFLATHRREVVAKGVLGLAVLYRRHATESQATAEHAEAHPEVWGNSTSEIAERFYTLAAGKRARAVQLEKLAERVWLEGLPAELLAYDPTVP